LWLAGKTLSDPATPWEKHLQDSIEPLHGVTQRTIRDALKRLVLDAEAVYFNYLPQGFCGTLSMEALVSDCPGPPIYLSERLTSEQRAS
jgi:hypothetical protein